MTWIRGTSPRKSTTTRFLQVSWAIMTCWHAGATAVENPHSAIGWASPIGAAGTRAKPSSPSSIMVCEPSAWQRSAPTPTQATSPRKRCYWTAALQGLAKPNLSSLPATVPVEHPCSGSRRGRPTKEADNAPSGRGYRLCSTRKSKKGLGCRDCFSQNCQD
jgi:hypothetical protein